MISTKKLLIFGSITAALAVVLGAFGAHALKPLLAENQLQSYETGVRYQLIHGLALVVLAMLAKQYSIQLFNKAGMVMFIGILIFSASIYLLSLKDLMGFPALRFLGPITPIGGLLMISAWVMVLLASIKIKDV
jgi:uncharacterized membrane protein YgdD (TMEM256/DUF423 family)